MGLETFKDTQGKKEEHKGINFNQQMDRCLDGAERKTCNESYDIRDTGVRGDPFCSSARKVVDRIISSSEKPSVGTNPDLHADTTRPGDNDVSSNKGNYGRKMSDSAEWLVGKQKDKKVPDAIKRKVFNS